MKTRNQIHIILILILFGISLIGCSQQTDKLPNQQGESQQIDKLSNTQWELVSLNGKDLIEGTTISLEFTETYLGGQMGCNGYGGTPGTGKYQAKSDGTFTLNAPFAVTVQLCTEPEGIMEQEAAYIEILMSAARYKIMGDRLEIESEDRETTLTYQSK